MAAEQPCRPLFFDRAAKAQHREHRPIVWLVVRQRHRRRNATQLDGWYLHARWASTHDSQALATSSRTSDRLRQLLRRHRCAVVSSPRDFQMWTALHLTLTWRWDRPQLPPVFHKAAPLIHANSSAPARANPTIAATGEGGHFRKRQRL